MNVVATGRTTSRDLDTKIEQKLGLMNKNGNITLSSQGMGI